MSKKKQHKPAVPKKIEPFAREYVLAKMYSIGKPDEAALAQLLAEYRDELQDTWKRLDKHER